MGNCCENSNKKSEGEVFIVSILESLQVSKLTFSEFLQLIEKFDLSFNKKTFRKSNLNSNPKSVKGRGRSRSRTIKSKFFNCKTSNSVKSGPKTSIRS